MATLWFVLVALMLGIYVVLDGFDLGIGAIYFWVGRTSTERAVVRQSIAPVWDANEVWLIAATGALYLAFPTLFASSFSGFYLPLMLVLWLFIGRGLGLEMRHYLEDSVAHALCEAIFMLSSAALTVMLGVALGNVMRGVPLDAEGYFFLPLWTDWLPGESPGVLDWYTVLCGLVSFVALGTHGALFLAARTTGEVNARARRLSLWGARLLPLLTLASLVATLAVRPTLIDNFRNMPLGLSIPVAVAASLVGMAWLARQRREWAAFAASTVYLLAMLAGAAFGLYPNLLPATTAAARTLTIHNAATGAYAQQVAITWWLVGFVLVAAAFRFLYGTLRGKLDAGTS